MPTVRRTEKHPLSPRPRSWRGAAFLAGILVVVCAPTTAGATTTTFSYTGSQQEFVVPAGVTSVHVLAVGGPGGDALAPYGGLGGAPAEVSGNLEVLPGQTLYVEVGGPGTDASFDGIAHAFNGGSYGGQGGTGGGGASDVRLISRPEEDTPESLFSRLIVAGGGGGGGDGIEGSPGGEGGDASSAGATVSAVVGGGAGSQEAGGIGGCPERECDGKLGSGAGGVVGLAGSNGGGGGGGLFGGAGGESNGTSRGAGGGGGSSLQPHGGQTVVPAPAGSAPQVQINWTPPIVKAPAEAPAGAPPASVSDAFTLLRPVVGRGDSLTLVLDLPGSGAVSVSATATHEIVLRRHGKRRHEKARFTFGTARAAVTAGAVELTIKPSTAGRKALAAEKPLPLAITVTFSPAGGKPAAKQLKITLPRR